MKIEKICQYHCIKDNEYHILEKSLLTKIVTQLF